MCGCAAAGAQREVLGLRGVVHVVGGPDVLRGPRPRCPAEAGRACFPAPSPCRGPGRRRKSHGQPAVAAAAAPTPAMAAIAPATSPAVGARAATPSAATATSPSSAATAAVSSMACAAPRSCARCPTFQEALYVVGSAYDLRWWLRLRPWAGQYVLVDVLVEGLRRAPAPTSACTPSAALRRRPVMEGGP